MRLVVLFIGWVNFWGLGFSSKGVFVVFLVKWDIEDFVFSVGMVGVMVLIM